MMNKWYNQLLNEIRTLGNRIFLYDPNYLLDDKNFSGELSKYYAIHEYQNDANFYLFLNKHSSDYMIIYSKVNISRDFIRTKFIRFELSLDSVFPDMDVKVLNLMDISYYQQIFNYYHEIKLYDQSIDAQQLILKSVWDIDMGELYSLTNNLKIALSYLIDDKEIPPSIIHLISEKLEMDLSILKGDKNLFNSWLEGLLKDYIQNIGDNNPSKYDFLII